MDAELLGRGLIIGFSIAAPVGPIGVLCIRRTLADGRTAGLLAGLGAATADALYGCVAGFGMTAVSGFLVNHRAWIQFAGGLFLLLLGVRTLISRPADASATASSATASGRSLAAGYGSTFLLTLTNPMTILAFTGIFAALGIVNTGGDFYAAALLVLGVFTGSAAWWLILSGGVGFLRERLDARVLLWINRFSGLVLVIFGVAALLQSAG